MFPSVKVRIFWVGHKICIWTLIFRKFWLETEWLSLICWHFKTSIYYILCRSKSDLFSIFLFLVFFPMIAPWRLNIDEAEKQKWIFHEFRPKIHAISKPRAIYSYANTTKFIDYAVHTKIVYKSILVQ